MITDYGCKQLTQSSDKLPAVAGLAKRFLNISPIPGNEYFAGLWKYSMLRDLLWAHQSVLSFSFFGDMVRSQRMSYYRAPSWSWASVDGGIRWPFPDESGSSLCASLICAVIRPREPSNPYGEVKQGSYLTISALLWRLPEVIKQRVLVHDACWCKFADVPFRKIDQVYLDEEQLQVAEQHMKEDIFFSMIARNCGLILGSEACPGGGVNDTNKASPSDTPKTCSDISVRQYRCIGIVRLIFQSRMHCIEAPVEEVRIV